MSWIGERLWLLWCFFWLLSLLVALSSPFEALRWWAGWKKPPPEPLIAPEAPSQGPFAVYLTGVAGFSGDFLSRRERGFLQRLQERVPGLQVVDDVFPYSATNNPLDGDRLLRALWVWLQKWRLKIPNNVFDLLIIMHNIGQTLVSSDRRYGPAYNSGVARAVAQRLRQKGFQKQAVYLVAYSGGAQIAVGLAPHLKKILECPLYVISLGGVYTDDPGIRAVDHLYDFKGTRDHLMPSLGWLLYPGRWRAAFFSPWNQARRSGKMSWQACGPITHIGSGDYFSAKQHLPDGTLYAEQSAALIAALIQR
ncbi:MAG: hypothetical protein KF760_26720 [Candidatus Eremiobacteraeota bacterium]|nr:hypothetical protein [Candidatus Eremiobacteraeota bacterium]MCW5868828.1 hypothetical protein [Candidatus Eremiobacteraeota bacterium]